MLPILYNYHAKKLIDGHIFCVFFLLFDKLYRYLKANIILIFYLTGDSSTVIV